MTIFSTYATSKHPNTVCAARETGAETRGSLHRTDNDGHFVASPWEGLRWETDPSDPSQSKSDLMDGIEEFLASIRHGE